MEQVVWMQPWWKKETSTMARPAHQRRRSGEAFKSDTAPIAKVELHAKMRIQHG